MHTLLDLKLADSIDHDRRAAAAAQGKRSARLASRPHWIHRHKS